MRRQVSRLIAYGTVFMTLFVTSPRLPWAVQGPLRAQPSAAQQKRSLSAGDRMVGAITDPLEYRLELPEGHYVRLTVSFDSSIVVTLRPPADAAWLTLELNPVDSVPFSFITESAGTYELTLTRADRAGKAAGYELKVRELRPQQQDDRLRLVIEGNILEADQLASDWTRASMEKAVSLLEDAREHSRRLEDIALEARVQRSLGVLYQRLLRTDEALSALSASISLARASQDPLAAIRAMSELVRIDAGLGRTESGRETAAECLQLSEHVDDGEARAICQEAMGYILSYVSPEQAVPYDLKARELWKSLENRPAEARVLTELGHAYAAEGEEERSRECFEGGLQIQRELGNPEQLAWAIQGLAAHLSKLDEKDRALNLLYEAQAISERIYSPRLHGALLAGLGMLFFDGSNERIALDYFKEALKSYRMVDNAQDQGATLELIGWAQLNLEQPGSALEAFAEALPFFERLKDRRNLAILSHFRGEAYSELSRFDEAIESFRRALAFLQETGDGFAQFLTLFGLGRAYQGANQPKAALDPYSRALELTLQAGYRHREAQVRFRLAQVYLELGRTADARRQAAASVEVAESVRSDFPGEFRTIYLASAHALLGLYIDVLEESHRQEPDAGYDALAFRVSEQARARSLLDNLETGGVRIGQGVDPELLRREEDLRARLNQASDRQISLPPDAEDEARAVRDEIERLTAEYTHLDALIRIRSPQYASLTRPTILSLQEVQDQLLDRDTLLLEYQLGERKSLLWVVEKNAHSFYTLPPRAEIEKTVLELVELLEAREPRRGETTRQRRLRIRNAEKEYGARAAAVSRLLLADVDAISRHKRLLIVSDGALQYVPFAALPTPEGSDAKAGKPLIAEHELVRLPSASILAALRKQAAHRAPKAGTLAILADPVLQPDDPRLTGNSLEHGLSGSSTQSGGLTRHHLDASRFPRLPATQYEAEAIADLLPEAAVFKATGFDASRKLATSSRLRGYRIVHFATHSILDLEHPGLSGVVLSMYDRNGNPVDGFLRLHDIYNLDLPADMVVLSACESYLGKEFKGEGLVGLVRGFMYAGADSVVASLWKVDDLATKELMVHFYQALSGDRKTAVAALRDAQLRLMETPDWKSPFYWAGFIVQGDWETKIEHSGD